MNDEERDQYRPECGRCRNTITDIDWADTTPFGGPPDQTPSYMRCSKPGCYDHNGSSITSPHTPGTLTIEDHAWIKRVSEPARDRG